MGLLLAGALLVAPESAPAVTLTLVTFGASDVSVGSTVTAQLSVSGLGDASAPALSSWDVDIAFDPTLLSLSSVTFASPSELAIDFASLQSSGVNPVGPTESRVDAAETSFDDPATLEAGQPQAFLLATLAFTGLDAGAAVFAFAQAVLGDADGAPLSASVSVEAPEPSSFALMGLAAAALLRRAGRRRV
jgi:hypothetical protein